MLALSWTASTRWNARRWSIASAQLFTSAAVFDKAEKLVEKYRARAEAIADEIEPIELRELLYYLVDSVLDQTTETNQPEPALLQLSPLVMR